MREIVCAGPAEAVQDHLTDGKRRLIDFAEGIGLPLPGRFEGDAGAVALALAAAEEEGAGGPVESGG